uniref:Caspase-9 n=2 Tax=Lygus hesperus TaxID=30085 RepID=A0A0A9YIE2_LYGHE
MFAPWWLCAAVKGRTMDARHREMININIPTLVEKTENIELIIDELVRKEAISENLADQIRMNNDPSDRAKALYCLLPKKGSPNAFRSLLEAFHETGNNSVALILKDNRLCNQSPTEGMSPTEEDEFFEEKYRMKTDPRGIVLLINVFDHDDEYLETRHGSKKDMKDLRDLWERMGFLVKDEARGTKKDIEESIIEWKNQEQMSKVDCGIVMIMAHGREVSPDSGTVQIDTRDKKTVNSEWIVKQMSSSEASRLHGKPKLLFILTCRGERTDAGLDLYRLNEFMNAPPLRDARPTIDSHGRFEGYAMVSPLLSDVLLIYPCAPGNASSRDPENGSWFVQTMIEVFNRKAHKDDVETMLKEMDRKLVKKTQDGIHDSFQVICTTSRGFKRRLFLNPPTTFSNGN